MRLGYLSALRNVVEVFTTIQIGTVDAAGSAVDPTSARKGYVNHKGQRKKSIDVIILKESKQRHWATSVEVHEIF